MKKIGVILLLCLGAVLLSPTAALAASSEAAQPEYYGSWVDYIWIIGALLLLLILIFRKLGQLNAKMLREEHVLESKKIKKKK